jgi:Tetratricopeptide repeat
MTVDRPFGIGQDAYLESAASQKGQDHFVEGEPLVRRALELRAAHEGLETTGAAGDLAVLGALLLGQQRYTEAETVLERSLATWQRRYGHHHYEVAVVKHNLAALYQARGDQPRALRTLNDVLDKRASPTPLTQTSSNSANTSRHRLRIASRPGWSRIRPSNPLITVEPREAATVRAVLAARLDGARRLPPTGRSRGVCGRTRPSVSDPRRNHPTCRPQMGVECWRTGTDDDVRPGPGRQAPWATSNATPRRSTSLRVRASQYSGDHQACAIRLEDAEVNRSSRSLAGFRTSDRSAQEESKDQRT